MGDIVDVAREQVLEQGIGLRQEQLVEVLQTPDDRLPELLALAHEVRVKWCGEEIEVGGSSRSRPVGARRTATSARSRGSSRRRCARSG